MIVIRKHQAGSGSFFSKLRPSRSVGTRLFVIYFVSSMVLVLALGGISYNTARRTIEEHVLEASEQTVIQTADKLEAGLLRYEDAVRRVTEDRGLRSAVSEALRPGAEPSVKERAAQEAQDEVEELASLMQSIRAVYWIPAQNGLEGIAAGQADPSLLREARTQEWYKAASSSQNPVWRVITGREAGAVRILLAESNQAEAGLEGYTAMLELELSAVAEQLQGVALGTGSYLQLVTEQDQPIFSSKPQETDSYLNLGGTLFAGITAKHGSLPTRDEAGEPILAVYGTVHPMGWKLLGVVPSDTLTEDAGAIWADTFLTIGAAALLAVLIGLWMMRIVSRPLNALHRLMLRGAEGDLTVRTSHVSYDEIGRLSADFNVMMERISGLVEHTAGTAGEVLETAAALGEVSRKTADAAREIAAATEEIAGGAGSLATEAERGNELSERIALGMCSASEAGHEMDRAAKSVGEHSREGLARLERLRAQTEETGRSAGVLSAKLTDLQTTVSSVVQILDVMKGITQQTHILALNANIEASRAGEAGLGFRVVAGEIRKLADQTRESITMVAEIAESILKEMDETAAAFAQVAPVFEEQRESVESTAELFLAVQQHMDNLISRLYAVTASVDSLNDSQKVLAETMGNVSSVAQESSASTEEVASLCDEQGIVGEQLVALSQRLEKTSFLLKDKLAQFVTQ